MVQRFEGYDYEHTGLGYPGWSGSLFAETLMQEISGGYGVNPTEIDPAERQNVTETVRTSHWLQLVDGTAISG